MKVMLLENYTK